jgi:alanyl-tRNA synthetase
MTAEEISQVETMVNAKIKENIPVVINEMNKEEAIGLGAMALFGEKYGDKVRVVVMDPAYSIELCGGTHVGHTGEIGVFILKAEASVAAGVRRIEAVVGAAAEKHITEVNEKLHKQIVQLTEACALLAVKTKASFKAPEWNENSAVSVLNDTIASLQSSQKELSKKLESQEALLVNELTTQYSSQFETINGIAFLGKEIALSSADNLKKLAAALGLTQNNHCIILVTTIEGKASVAVSVSESLSATMPATQIIKEKIAPLIKGGGGGQKTLATAGGQDTSQLKNVIELVKQGL